MTTGIYSIVNKVNGKRYTGSAVDVSRRCYGHVRGLLSGKHHSVKLQRAFDKYGEDSFECVLLLVCSKENLLMYEQMAIDSFDAVAGGYNVSPTAASPLGIKRSPEFIQGIRDRQTGKRLPKEHVNSLVRSHIGKPKSEMEKAAIRAGMSKPETRKKMSDAAMGRYDQQTANRLAEARRGLPLSEERKLKISESRKGCEFSEDHKRKLSEAAKRRVARQKESK